MAGTKMKHKYIVKDWAGNEMDWGTFETEEDAFDYIVEHVRLELLNDGLNVNEIQNNTISIDYPELDLLVNKIVEQYEGEYYVDEVLI